MRGIPPLPGSAWWLLFGRQGGSGRSPTPAPPPPVPGQGKYRPLLNRVPDVTDKERHRLAHDLLADAHNALVRRGQLVQVRNGEWKLVPAAGVTGSFTTTDGKTITIVDGVVTKIV